MTDDKRRALTDAYGEIAEELRILYISLKCEEFTSEEAIAIMTAMLSQPNSLGNYTRRNISRAEKMERLREYMNERKARVENDKKPDFTNHTGDDYEQ